jgi:hypothetical protein
MLGTAPDEYAHYLSENGYHPRSDKHGEKMCDFLLRDLYENCPTLRALANSGSIVYQTDYVVFENTPDKWTIDLVIGPSSSRSLPKGPFIAKANPSEVWVAIDAKGIMTEHGKCRRNRQRDLNSMANILHRMTPEPIVGGYVIINMATEFRSPLRDVLTLHKNIQHKVAETVPLFLQILKDEESGRAGIDAIGVTIIEYTNLPRSTCTIIRGPPAPDHSSPLQHDNFVSRICTELVNRFSPSR